MKKIFIFLSLIVLFNFNQEIFPDSKASGPIVATKAGKPVTIDGDLSEWQDLKPYLVTEDMNVMAQSITSVNKKTTALHSAFYVQWDDKNLYMACNVTDSIIVSNIAPGDNEEFFRTDSVEFYIDSREEQIFKIAVLPFDTNGNVQACRHEDSNPGPIKSVAPDVKVASKRTAEGYIIEVSVPFKYIMNKKPKAGIKLGFSHTVHNSNDKNADIGEYSRENIISWNPEMEIWFKPKDWSDLILK